RAYTWDSAGHLAKLSMTPTGSATVSTQYTYDADGKLLIQRDPATTTLYLPDEEITVDSGSGAALAATRYYRIGDTLVPARTAAGQVDYLTSDLHGPSRLAVDAASLSANRRYYDPYGNPIGSAPVGWPGSRGFVGGTADPVTGLTNLGAREYDPALDHFIS